MALDGLRWSMILSSNPATASKFLPKKKVSCQPYISTPIFSPFLSAKTIPSFRCRLLSFSSSYRSCFSQFFHWALYISPQLPLTFWSSTLPRCCVFVFLLRRAASATLSALPSLVLTGFPLPPILPGASGSGSSSWYCTPRVKSGIPVKVARAVPHLHKVKEVKPSRPLPPVTKPDSPEN